MGLRKSQINRAVAAGMETVMKDSTNDDKFTKDHTKGTKIDLINETELLQKCVDRYIEVKVIN